MKRKFLLAPALLVALVLGNHATQAQQKNESGRKEIRSSLNVTSTRSDGSGETHIDYVEDGHRYKIRLDGSKIVEMYVDGKKVPEADYAKYEPKVKVILEQIEKDRKQAEMDRAQAEKDRQQAAKDREQADKEREQARRDREQAERDRGQAQRDRQQAERDRSQAQKDRAQAEIDRKKAEEDRKLVEALFEELVTEKLVEDRQSLTSLELDDAKLVINGKEQPQSVHSRYKQKYLKGAHNQIRYRNSGESRTLTVN